MIYQDERIDKVNENILLIQKKNGLTFGTDALLLAAFIKSSPKSVAVDFGAGSGIISFLCIARKKFNKIFTVEIQKDFCDIISRNIQINSFSDKISVINKDVRNLTFSDINCEADVIFSNPPYMRSGSGKQNDSLEKAIARHEVFGNIFDFCSSASKNLKHGGKMYFVYRPERMTELFYAMKNSQIEPKRLCFVHPDSFSSPSLILVDGKKGASSEIKITKPLIMYKDLSHTEYTDDFQYIYDNGEFKE